LFHFIWSISVSCYLLLLLFYFILVCLTLDARGYIFFCFICRRWEESFIFFLHRLKDKKIYTKFTNDQKEISNLSSPPSLNNKSKKKKEKKFHIHCCVSSMLISFLCYEVLLCCCLLLMSRISCDEKDEKKKKFKMRHKSFKYSMLNFSNFLVVKCFVCRLPSSSSNKWKWIKESFWVLRL
jgi:hypothetical protein